VPRIASFEFTACLEKSRKPLPGGGAAVYTASGLSYYRHSDWLGSSRLASTPTRTVYSTTAYAPFGEPYAQSGTADLSFTGQNQDTVGGSYDFLAREYAIQGRWPSPDPAGLAVADPSNPQSLNRYAYLLNNPLALVDPLGLGCGDWFTDVISAQCSVSSSNPGMYGNGGNGSWEYGCVVVPGNDSHPPIRQCGLIWVPGRNRFDLQRLGPGVRPGAGPGSGPRMRAATPPPPPPSPQKVTAGCLTGGLIKNFLGDDVHAGATVILHVATYAAVKRLVPALLPGPGWLYAGFAALWDVEQTTKSYVDCKYSGGPSLQ